MSTMASLGRIIALFWRIIAAWICCYSVEVTGPEMRNYFVVVRSCVVDVARKKVLSEYGPGPDGWRATRVLSAAEPSA
jgi:hypothetical protein